MKKRILILGASGMLGHQMWRQFNKNSDYFEVYGTVRKETQYYKKFNLPNLQNLIEIKNIAEFDNLKNKITELKPDYIINCIGLTLRKDDIQNIEKCYLINSMLPQYLSQLGNLLNFKLIHFSTDCIFDGKKGFAYSQNELPTAFDNYGMSKYLGEVKEKPHLTFRLSIVGREIENKTEFFEWIFSQKNKQAFGYDQVIYSGVTTNFITQEIISILKEEKQITGLWQISSEPISKYEIIKKMNHLFNLNINLVAKSEYVSNKTLSSDEYSHHFGFIKPNWDFLLNQLKEDNNFYENL